MHRDLAAAAEREARDRRDHRLARARDAVPVAAKSPRRRPCRLLPAISLMSAPAANALSEPVMTMQPMPSSASNASIAACQLLDQRGVERIERLRPVEADDADLAAGLDDDVLVGHDGLRLNFFKP